MYDHAGIDRYLNKLAPVPVTPLLAPLHPCAGSIRFYERTAHISDSSTRFASACALRAATERGHTLIITGGDTWWLPFRDHQDAA